MRCWRRPAGGDQREEKWQEVRAAATVRARELGFLPNEQLWSLAMNKEDRGERGATDGMSWSDVSLSPGAGAVTRASHRALQARGAALLAERPLQPGDEAVNRLQLAACGARAAHGWLRLSPDDQRNDQLVAALELDAGDEAPVPPESVGDALIAYHMALPTMLRRFPRNSKRAAGSPQDCFSSCSVDRFYALSRLFGAELIDRTGTLSNGLRLEVLRPIPQLDPGFDLSLEDVILGRCRALLSTHERLRLLWSGGIDTTAMVVGFLRVATPADWEGRLSVHYCPRSITEHPQFFENFIQKLPQHELIDDHQYQQVRWSSMATAPALLVLVQS
eukprot:COSAG04_NODE_301_length_17421_cov_23.392045_2_plen_333_part_00